MAGQTGASSEAFKWLTEPSKRWLLVVGGHLGASSGAPLPYYQTAWSPSLLELVRYHISQTHSRDAANNIEQALATTASPLRFIADTLQAQEKWLQQQTQSLAPQGPILYLAELARHGMFQGVVSAAYDSMLPDALSLLRVPYTRLSLSKPRAAQGHIPYLREYDDTLFQDTAAHRKQEARFLRERIRSMLEEVDGVLIVGHPPYETDLLRAIQATAAGKESVRVVWLEEQLRLTRPAFGVLPEGNPKEWVEQLGDRGQWMETDDLSETFQLLAEQRHIPVSKWVHNPSPKGLSAMLNQTVDMRPVLVYIPGVSLFEGLIKKLPRISLRAILSLSALVLLLFVGLHWRDIYLFEQQMKKPQQAYAKAMAPLNAKRVTLKHYAASSKHFADALALWKKVSIPKGTPLVVPQLAGYLKKQHAAFASTLRKARAEKLLPGFVQARSLDQLEDDSLMKRLGAFPDVTVARFVRKAKSFKNRSWVRVQRKHPLSFYAKHQHRALCSNNGMLLRVLQYNQVRSALQQGKLAFVLDLRKRKPLIQQAFAQARTLLGYHGKQASLFGTEGLQTWFKQGKVLFVFAQLDNAGSVRRSIERIQALRKAYPRARTLLSFHRRDLLDVLAQRMPKVAQLLVMKYRFQVAKAFLHDNTSSLFFEGVNNNSYLRWNWDEPLVMAMLIEYYRGVGRPPRGLGILYQRLLRRMLVKQRLTTLQKFSALEFLAFACLSRRQDAFSMAEALRWFRARKLPMTEAQLTNIVQEVIEQGVLRKRSLHTIGFVDKRFRMLFAARHLRHRPFAFRKRFLLQQSELFVSFYVSVKPHISRLIKAWLDDFEAMQTRLTTLSLHHRWVNPLSPSLLYAAMAVHDGKVHSGLLRRLEDILFRWYDYNSLSCSFGLAHCKMLTRALDFLSSQGSKQRILEGIAKDSDLDHRLLRLTARSSSDIYEAEVMKWLQRVCTEKDKRRERWAYTSKEFKLPQHKRGEPDSLSQRFEVAIKNALTTLIQSGSPASLRFVVDFVTPDKDFRFQAGTWHRLRYHTIKRMLSNGHWKLVFPLLSRLAKADPPKWKWLVTRLSKANDPKAAALLFTLLQEQLPAVKQLPVWRKQRKAYQKKMKAYYKEAKKKLVQFRTMLVAFKKLMRKRPRPSKAVRRKMAIPILKFRREFRAFRKTKPKFPYDKKKARVIQKRFRERLDTKSSLVVALARFDKRIARPLFLSLLQPTKRTRMDLRPYGAYGLSLLKEKKHFPVVKKLVKEYMATPPNTSLAQRWRKEIIVMLNKSIVCFSHKEAFVLFTELAKDKTWRKLDTVFAIRFESFAAPQMQSFALKRLLCAKSISSTSAWIRSIAAWQTTASRRLIYRLLALSTVRDEPAFRKEVCGGGELLPYKTIRKRLSLHALIEAIASFREPNDLPRMLVWSRSSKFLIALEAYSAMRYQNHPVIGQVLLRRFAKLKDFTSTVNSLLRSKDRIVDAEQLLQLFLRLYNNKIPLPDEVKGAKRKRLIKMRRTRRKKLKQLLKILGVHGDWKALLTLFPLQKEPIFYYRVRDAVFQIAQRVQGRPEWNPAALIKLLPLPKPPTKQAPTSKPTR